MNKHTTITLTRVVPVTELVAALPRGAGKEHALGLWVDVGHHGGRGQEAEGHGEEIHNHQDDQTLPELNHGHRDVTKKNPFFS